MAHICTTSGKSVNSLTAMDGHNHPLFNELLWWFVMLTHFVHCYHLIARKLAVLFSFNWGVRTFYGARCIDKVSRGSVLCLLNASFGTAISQHHNSIFYSKINDHGVRRSVVGQILARWRSLVASKVALDLPYWAMRSALYHLIRMAIEMDPRIMHGGWAEKGISTATVVVGAKDVPGWRRHRRSWRIEAPRSGRWMAFGALT